MKHTIMWLVGALCAGLGVLAVVLGGIGMPGGDTALVYSTLGYDGMDNLGMTTQGVIGVVLFFGGIGVMVNSSNSAWKETGGY